MTGPPQPSSRFKVHSFHTHKIGSKGVGPLRQRCGKQGIADDIQVMNQTLLALTGVCVRSAAWRSPPCHGTLTPTMTAMSSFGYAVHPRRLWTAVRNRQQLTCDYDGTPFEEWVGSVWNGGVIVDSILVQYHIIDSAQVYMAGCPDPMWEVASYERAWMTTSSRPIH